MLTTVTTNPTSAPSSKTTSTDSSCVDNASCVVNASSDYDDGITNRARYTILCPQQIRWMRVTGCLSAFVRIFWNSQSAGWRRISTGPNCSHCFHHGADAISWTTINIAVSPKSGNVPSKFARHVRELMFQNARNIGNVSRVWQYKQDANQGSTVALEARVILGITMQFSGTDVHFVACRCRDVRALGCSSLFAERLLFQCYSFT